MDRAGVLALLVLVTAAQGCSEESGLCVRASDCPAGQVCADGVCTTPGDPDGGDHDAAPDLRLDGGVDQWIPDYATLDGDAGPVCTPNNNGKVERSEMVFTVPSKVTVTLGTQNLTVDLQGTAVGGVTTWDLTGAATDDQDVQMTLDPLPAWTAAKFPQASYASQLSASFGFFTKTALLGVFKVTPTALELVGAVSEKANHTRVTYGTPLEALRFPVVVKDSYSSSASMSGFSEYTIPVLNTETYAIDVLAGGKLKLLPSLTLDALLVRVRQEVYPTMNPLLKTKTTVFLFVVECYGTVARVIADSDPGAALDQVKVSERWKLAAP